MSDELILRTSNVDSLQERAKELSCLYRIEEILERFDLPLAELFVEVCSAISPGFQYPKSCFASIEYDGSNHTPALCKPTRWSISSGIIVQTEVAGALTVYYTQAFPDSDDGPFFKEEQRLLDSIAKRIGNHIFHRSLLELRPSSTDVNGSGKPAQDWRGPVELIRRTDKELYLRMSRKILNQLYWMGSPEAQEILDNEFGDPKSSLGEINQAASHIEGEDTVLLTERPFEIASEYLTSTEIIELVQKWAQENKARFFVKLSNDHRTTLAELADGIRRFRHAFTDGSELPFSILNGIRVSLIRRMLTEQLDYIKIAKEHIEVDDFQALIDHTIVPGDGQGKLGGKAVGLFVASKILERNNKEKSLIKNVKTPKTWYLASDGVSAFMWHNNLEDLTEQKYKPIEQVRQEYPNVVQLFRSSEFPASLVQRLAIALDSFGDTPLIVRSSSLLEDRLGTAFSGKYKSLFLPNVGPREERLVELMDAIAEVYASTFSPDPIEYRRMRGLIDFKEEMAVLIQAVVGQRVGKYFFPAFAGVAFSNNEFRWSPRIDRKDGLIRLVPGLGTRAVDRVGDDYPILVVPGKKELRANTSIDEIVSYSPRRIDLLNLETKKFETLEIKDLLEEIDGDYPAVERVFSIRENDVLRKPSKILLDLEKDELVATFNALFTETTFVEEVGEIVKHLEETLETPVDIEFAHDGIDLYLLQCRPQSFLKEERPAAIPKDVTPSSVVFSANRYVSNGWLPEISHIVYVDPEGYSNLESREELLQVGRAVSIANKLLPKRQFILMGPGRWGSRGDIKLGVSVTYSDINNTAMLIEIAKKTGSYLPDLSFGTHFFQDLVESSIRYLPLYPDDPGVRFNEPFFRYAKNLLPTIAPDYAHLAEVVKIIDVRAETEGKVLSVLLNADLDEALALVTEVTNGDGIPSAPKDEIPHQQQPDMYWRWRLQMAERIAEEIDPSTFDVRAFYVFGSTKNASAGPGSDIDILIHVGESPEKRHQLLLWLDGWSRCLAEINYLRTGYRQDRLLDVHFVTDEDIANRTSFAVKIGAVTDAARELPMGTARS